MDKTEIEIIRGDSFAINVRMTDKEGKEIIVGEDGQVYFTMKKTYNDEEAILQKDLNDGIVYSEEIGYRITFNTNDTNELPYGKYVFDIEYKVNDFVRTVAIGTIKLKNEVTFKENEV